MTSLNELDGNKDGAYQISTVKYPHQKLNWDWSTDKDSSL